MFEIGQQVVCVYEGPWIDCVTWESPPGPVPYARGVYTIAGIELCDFGRVGLAFEELIWSRPSGGRATFDSTCFRPVRKTSIEVFREILVKPPKVLERV